MFCKTTPYVLQDHFPLFVLVYTPTPLLAASSPSDILLKGNGFAT